MKLISLPVIEPLSEQTRLLSKAYNDAASFRGGVEVISMSVSSQEHELGSEAPWVTGFGYLSTLWEGIVPYHPNLAAHESIADVLFERISSDPHFMNRAA